MSFVGDVVGGIFGTSKAGSQAADASVAAAQIAAQSQREALDYYKQAMAPTLAAQKSGLQKYQQAISGGFDSVAPLQATSAKQLYSQALNNPMLAAQLDQAEEAALRASAATGGLRGGGAISDVANVRTGLINKAYQDEYARDQQNLALKQQAQAQNLALQQQNISNLGSLAGLNTGSEAIANMMSGIGQTQASGLTAAAQAQQAAAGQTAGITSGLLGLGTSALLFSDERLKDNLTIVSGTAHPMINKYSWEWNDAAEELSMSGNDSGYVAQEIEKVWPDLVIEHSSGYKQINLPAIENRLMGLN